MRFTKNLPYKIKRLVPVLGLAGAAAMMPGCDKSDEPIYNYFGEPYKFVYLYFSPDDYSRITPENVKSYADNPNIDSVYLVPQGMWHCSLWDRQDMKKQYLEPALFVSPKVFGHGDFQINNGDAFNVPDDPRYEKDSLWFVNWGWSVNQMVRDGGYRGNIR